LAYRIDRALEVRTDLDAIFDYLHQAALNFGDDPARAYQRAASRIDAIERSFEALDTMPHRGTRAPEIAANLRYLTKDRAVIYFEVDDRAQVVHVLAVFYGGQDHRNRMIARLLGP
jgi:plasmid stabilization system protein ParE